MGSLFLYPGSGEYKVLLCPLRVESLFPSVLWRYWDPVLLGIKVRFPGNFQSLGQIPRLMTDVGPRTFTVVQEHFWYYCSPVDESSNQWVQDSNFSCLCHSYHFVAASPLSLVVGYLFLVGSSIFLFMVVQQLVAILVLWQEKMSACPFSAILDQSQ